MWFGLRAETQRVLTVDSASPAALFSVLSTIMQVSGPTLGDIFDHRKGYGQ